MPADTEHHIKPAEHETQQQRVQQAQQKITRAAGNADQVVEKQRAADPEPALLVQDRQGQQPADEQNAEHRANGCFLYVGQRGETCQSPKSRRQDQDKRATGHENQVRKAFSNSEPPTCDATKASDAGTN